MAGAASAHQASTASREQISQQRAGPTRRTSADPQQAQQGATAAAAAPTALNRLSRLQHLADASPQVAQLRRLQELADGRFAPMAQLAGGPEEEELVQGKFATAELQPQLQQAPRANNTGLPDQLKSGIESLSGLSMDHVRVHLNSSQPAQLNAHAYAQGSDIHVARGQEQHLPHEVWHVVQQAQGRVRPTLQMKAVEINDDPALEKEADTMAEKATSIEGKHIGPEVTDNRAANRVIQAVLDKARLNVAGENHDVSDKRRDGEKAFSLAQAGGQYWTEGEFPQTAGAETPADSAPLLMQFELAVIKELASVLKPKFEQKGEALLSDPQWSKWEEKLKKEFEYVDNLHGELDDGHCFLEQVGRCQELEEALEDKSYEKIQSYLGKFEADTNIPTIEEASALRGKAMHEAAQAQYETLGVWKIGDAHVSQIIALPGGIEECKYNLMSEAEFNDEYEQWVPPPPP